MLGISDAEPVSLGRAVRLWRDEILSRWQERLRRIPGLSELPQEELADHLPVVLSSLAAELGDERPAAQHETGSSAEQHAVSRVVQAIPLPYLLQELAHLRQIAIDLWMRDRAGRYGLEEVRELNRSLDALVAHAVSSYSATQQRTADALDRMAMVGMDALSLEPALQQLLRILTEAVENVDTAAIFLVERDRLALRAVLGARKEELGRFSVAIGEGFAGSIAATRQPAFTAMASSDPRVRSGALHAMGIRALYGVPLISHGDLVGVATIGSATEFRFPELTRRMTGLFAGRVADVIGFQQSVGNREHLLSELESRSAQMSAVLDSIADGLAVYGPRGEIIRMNDAAAQLLGYTTQEAALPLSERLALRPFVDASGHPVRPELLPGFRALRGELVRNETVCRKTQDGRLIWLSVSAAPIRLSSGRVRGAVSTFIDVTRMHERQRQTEDLVRMLSHDLRTPLGTITLQARLLAQRARAADEAGRSADATIRSADAILRSASRMLSMIEDLVDLARLEMGGFRVDPRPMEVAPVIRELLERLRGTLDIARVRAEVPSGLPRLLADPARFERILTNLLSNALKYSPPGSQVVLTAEESDGRIVVAVQDSGQGIGADELPHVFERYFRTRNAKRVDGLGLGLYITRLLVEAQGGAVRAASEPGKGSTFSVVLPAATS